jgi:hypothetical protein
VFVTLVLRCPNAAFIINGGRPRGMPVTEDALFPRAISLFAELKFLRMV